MNEFSDELKNMTTEDLVRATLWIKRGRGTTPERSEGWEGVYLDEARRRDISIIVDRIVNGIRSGYRDPSNIRECARQLAHEAASYHRNGWRAEDYGALEKAVYSAVEQRLLELPTL